jgi:hypothetical protein
MDGEKTFKDAKEAAPWLGTNRKVHQAAERAARTGEDDFRAGYHVGLEDRVRREARERGQPLDVVTPTYQNKKPGETVTTKQAADDLAEYRRTTAKQEAADYEQRLAWAAELGVADLIAQQQPAEQAPVEAPEQPSPEPAQQQQPVDPVEQHRQQAAQYLEAARQYHDLTSHEALARAQIEQAVARHQQEFGAIQTHDQLARLSADQQQRFIGQQQAIRTAAEHFQALSAQRQLTQQQIRAAQQAEQDQAFQRYRAEQSAATEKAIPEMSPNADPAEAYAFKTAATNLLKQHLGIDATTVRSLSPELQRALHHVGFAEIVSKAVRYEQAQQRAAEVSAKPLPPVQRPGVASTRGDRNTANLTNLSERIDRARPGSDRQIKAAAALIAAKRRGR